MGVAALSQLAFLLVRDQNFQWEDSKRGFQKFTKYKYIIVFVTLLGPWSPSLNALSAIGTLISSFSAQPWKYNCF